MNTPAPHSALISSIAASPVATFLEPLYARLGEAVESSGYAAVLRGEGYLDHSAHPVLTDVPIGLLTATSVLDVLGGPKSRRARTILCALGVASAVPTAAAGLADWNRLEGEDRRIGVVHAAGNAVALMLYTKSTFLRLRGRHARGTLMALAGATVMTGAGYLGGELALNRGTAAHHPVPTGRSIPPTPGPDPTPVPAPTPGPESVAGNRNGASRAGYPQA